MMPDFGSAFLTALGWVVAGFLGAIPLVMLVRWWSEGYVAGSEVFGIAFLFLVMFALLMGPTPLIGKVIVFLLLTLSSVGLPYIVIALAKRDTRAFEEEKEAAYRSALAANPGNVAARAELARVLYGRRRKSEAIEEMEQVVQLSPKTTESENYLLKRWIQERDSRPDPMMICRWCREETPKDRPFCVHCERPTSGMREVADAIKGDLPDTLRLVLKLLPLMLIVAFIAPFLGTFPGKLLIVCVVVGGIIWFRSRLA